MPVITPQINPAPISKEKMDSSERGDIRRSSELRDKA
jgi:hypothetical protein